MKLTYIIFLEWRGFLFVFTLEIQIRISFYSFYSFFNDIREIYGFDRHFDTLEVKRITI